MSLILVTIDKELDNAAACVKQKNEDCAVVLARTQYMTAKLLYVCDIVSEESRRRENQRRKRN